MIMFHLIDGLNGLPEVHFKGGVYVAVLVAVSDSLGFGSDSMYIQIIAYTSTTISSVACTQCSRGE